MADIAEQIRAFEDKRAGLVAANEAIMTKAAEAGSTLDAEQEETFDGNKADLEAIDKHLDRLRSMEKIAATKAVPVSGGSSDDGSTTRGGQIVVKAQPKLEPGIEFARLVKTLGAAKGDTGRAIRIALSRYGEDSNAVGTLKRLDERGEEGLQFQGFEKANVVAGSTVSGTWAADLVLDEGGAFADFAEYLRPQTILGKFGQDGIPALRRVPFRTALGISAGAGSGYWVGEGKPKPLTAFDFNKTNLEPLKCANIVVLTQELLRSSSAAAETMVRDEMRNALVQLIDDTFIDPANSGTSDVEPAAITNGAVNGAASGTGDADDIRADMRSLFNEFITANSASDIVLIMRATDALAAGMLVNALGQAEFPGIGRNGGTLLQLPVITSQAVPSGTIVAVQPSEIYYADDGGFQVNVSQEASLQMLDNPTNDTVTPTATSLVSMFQTNSVAFLCERTLNWKRRRASAVAYLTGAVWGGSVNDLS
jgi:hypothetical protein